MTKYYQDFVGLNTFIYEPNGGYIFDPNGSLPLTASEQLTGQEPGAFGAMFNRFSGLNQNYIGVFARATSQWDCYWLRSISNQWGS